MFSVRPHCDNRKKKRELIVFCKPGGPRAEPASQPGGHLYYLLYSIGKWARETTAFSPSSGNQILQRTPPFSYISQGENGSVNEAYRADGRRSKTTIHECQSFFAQRSMYDPFYSLLSSTFFSEGLMKQLEKLFTLRKFLDPGLLEYLSFAQYGWLFPRFGAQDKLDFLWLWKSSVITHDSYLIQSFLTSLYFAYSVRAPPTSYRPSFRCLGNTKHPTHFSLLWPWSWSMPRPVPWRVYRWMVIRWYCLRKRHSPRRSFQDDPWNKLTMDVQ